MLVGMLIHLRLQISLKNDFLKFFERYIKNGEGTALNAIRYRGFIPWNGDIGFVHVTEKIRKVKQLFETELSDRYYLLAPETKQVANCFLPRVIKKEFVLGKID